MATKKTSTSIKRRSTNGRRSTPRTQVKFASSSTVRRHVEKVIDRYDNALRALAK